MHVRVLDGVRVRRASTFGMRRKGGGFGGRCPPLALRSAAEKREKRGGFRCWSVLDRSVLVTAFRFGHKMVTVTTVRRIRGVFGWVCGAGCRRKSSAANTGD